jgi:hypothetical protein
MERPRRWKIASESKQANDLLVNNDDDDGNNDIARPQTCKMAATFKDLYSPNIVNSNTSSKK